jgi:type III secretory pathway component EscU
MCPDDATNGNSTDLSKLKDLGWRELAIRWLFSQGATVVVLVAMLAWISFKYPEILKDQEAERARVRKEHEDERERMRLDSKQERKEFRDELKDGFQELKEAIEKNKI